MDKLPIEYQEFWKRWSDFDGKSTVMEFWIPFAINFAIVIIVTAISNLLNFDLLAGILTLALLIPSWTVLFRRLHDTRRSGWNILWGIIPFIGLIILIVFCIEESHVQ